MGRAVADRLNRALPAYEPAKPAAAEPKLGSMEPTSGYDYPEYSMTTTNYGRFRGGDIDLLDS